MFRTRSILRRPRRMAFNSNDCCGFVPAAGYSICNRLQHRHPDRTMRRLDLSHATTMTRRSTQAVGIRGMNCAMGHAVTQLFRSPGEPHREKKSGGIDRIIEFGAVRPHCAEPQPHRRKLEQLPPDRLPPRRGKAVIEERQHRHAEGVIPEQRQLFSSERFAGKPAQKGNTHDLC